MPFFSVKLSAPAHEMAQEEILKQVAFLSQEVQSPRFENSGQTLVFEASADNGESIAADALALAQRINRALRNLERKVLERTPEADLPSFAGEVDLSGVHFLGMGQVALEAVPLQLFRYFDRSFENFGLPWKARPLMTPTLIPDRVLALCDYFRSFPQYVTFASHLREDVSVIDDFRARHDALPEVDGGALADMSRPDACLSPAVCYHVYNLNRERTVPHFGLTYGICGKCFRYESSNIKDMRRLWDFTMREVVFLGARAPLLEAREKSIAMMARFLREHRLAGEIRTASDPFFVAPDAISKTYFQLTADSKYEVSLLLPNGERTAVGSHNYHSDFFGRAFHTDVESGGPMHSVCVAFGLERWVYAFMMQHGTDPGKWPDAIRNAPEFQNL